LLSIITEYCFPIELGQTLTLVVDVDEITMFISFLVVLDSAVGLVDDMISLFSFLVIFWV